MSEPFIARGFKEFAKKKWDAFDDEIDAITTRDGLSLLLQKKLRLSAKEADVQINKAIAEFERR